MKKKIAFFLTPVLFLLLVFGLTIVNFSIPDRGFSESENRYLQQKPKFSWEALFNGKFSTDVEDYITDQFPVRDGFIGVKTQTEYLLGKRDTNDVYFGNDGYLIEKHEESSLDQKQLGKNMDRLSGFVNRVSSDLGEEHVRVIVAPTAGEVLKDKLPAYAQEFSQAALFDRIRETIPESSWVDLLPTFKDASLSGEQVYYKTDHHWTTGGAFLAYRAWCESLGLSGMESEEFRIETITDQFYGTIYSKARLFSTKPDSIQAYYPKENLSYQVDYNLGERQTDSLYEESYLTKKDKYSYFLGGNNAVVKISGSNKNGKTLLLVKDSYAHSMAPFLANEFETIYMMDLRYYNGGLKKFQEDNQITDVLVLYNAVTFSEDLGVLKMNS